MSNLMSAPRALLKRLTGQSAAVAIALSLSGMQMPVLAGDHLDGLAVRAHAGGDITGLYAFMPNNGRGNLALAMGIKSFALSMSEVGDYTHYNFRIRRAGLEGIGANLSSRVGAEELRLSCKFFVGADELSCTYTMHEADGTSTVLASAAGDTDRSVWSADRMVHVVATMRSDPYMTNTHAVYNCLDDREAEFLTGTRKIKNSIVESKVNVIGLIAEVNVSALPEAPGFPLLAVVAESVDHKDGTVQRIDRAGRPETSVFLIVDDATRTAWNRHDPFDINGPHAFVDAMQHGMTAVDAHSRQGYWARPNPLLSVMLDDYLLLNPAVAVDPTDTSVNHYLEIEWAAYNGQPINKLAGGRRPVDNVVAKFFSVFARQGKAKFANLEALRHALYRPTHPRFPYLAAPYERVETVTQRTIVSVLPLRTSIRGCE